MTTKTEPVTAEVAAQILDRSVVTVYRLAKAGLLRRERVLGRVLFNRTDVEEQAKRLARD